MNIADVYLWGTRIGSVTQESLNAQPQFNYDEAFIRSGIEIAPLMMPLSARTYMFPTLNQESFYGLPGLLSDSLPDKFGTTVLSEYLAKQGRRLEEISPVERLLYTGKRGMGALEFRPAMDIAAPVSDLLRMDELAEIASRILEEREHESFSESEHLMEQIMDVGTSAGGARAKAVIAWNREKKEIRSGQTDAGEGFEHWLIKFDGVTNNKDHEKTADRKEYTRIEYAYYLMAISCGIDMSKCELYCENGLFHFMTRRFDRTDDGGKLHMQTLAAMEHLDFKYPGQSGYEQAAVTLKKLGLGQNETEQLFRRMVFNDIYINYDDHVKNISFLMDRSGGWSLAPAYDITYSFKADSLWVGRHQMRINGKQDGITYSDILESAKTMSIPQRKAKQITDEVISAKDGWDKFAGDAFLSDAVTAELKTRFIARTEKFKK